MSNIVFESTYENIRDFVGKHKNNLKGLVDLSVYIRSTNSLNVPPTKFEQEFIEMFFGTDNWVKYINEEKSPKFKYFKHIPPFDLQTISQLLSFEVMLLVQENLSKKSELNVKKLKSDLKDAVSASEFDGVFDKVEGWCNVYDVLKKYKLLKE
jgi:hypothetical protein